MSFTSARPVNRVDSRTGSPATDRRRMRVRRRLESYEGSTGMRELVLLAGAGGSRLLVDRSADACEHPDGDARLLAHLAADEPESNARLVCSEYLASRSRCCRALVVADFARVPLAEHAPATAASIPELLIAGDGSRYHLSAVGSAPAQLRWVRSNAPAPGIVSARDVVGALEDYEPVRRMSRAAIAEFRSSRSISVGTLAIELRRLQLSPIVLNRRLREAVLTAIARDGVSLSAIAVACGRIKRDRHGNRSGETSWLARRIGLLCEHGAPAPNPWVHSDTLALIARDGLGIAPREVELD
jgi:hypothetical protein